MKKSLGQFIAENTHNFNPLKVPRVSVAVYDKMVELGYSGIYPPQSSVQEYLRRVGIHVTAVIMGFVDSKRYMPLIHQTSEDRSGVRTINNTLRKDYVKYEEAIDAGLIEVFEMLIEKGHENIF